MTPRPLGSTGLLVSPLGLGTVKLGRNTGVKYPEAFRIPDDDAAGALLDRAHELGINLLDTAPAYGTSEERIGQLLASGYGGGRRAWVLATKAGEEFDPATGQSRFDFSPAAVRASVQQSLRRLRTDRLDVVLLHCDHRDEWIVRESGALEALREMQRDGSIGAVGASTKSVTGGMAALERCDVVMLTYNLHEREMEPVIDAAARRGVGVLVKKGLMSGHAAGESSVADSMRLVLGRSGVSSLIVGTINAAHLEQNVRAAASCPPPGGRG